MKKILMLVMLMFLMCAITPGYSMEIKGALTFTKENPCGAQDTTSCKGKTSDTKKCKHQCINSKDKKCSKECPKECSKKCPNDKKTGTCPNHK